MLIAKNISNITKKSLSYFQNIEILKKSWLVGVCCLILMVLSFRIDGGAVILSSLPLLIISAVIYPFYLVLTKILIEKSNKNFKSMQVEYYFESDCAFIKEIDRQNPPAKKLDYNQILKIKQTRKYLFLYITKSSAMVVEKIGFEDNDFTKLIHFLEIKHPRLLGKKIKTAS